MNRISLFFREVRAEMSKVSWPTKTQLMRYTGVVLGISLVIALYLGGLDAAFSALLKSFIIR